MTLLRTSVSHQAPQRTWTFWISILQIYQEDVLAGDGEGVWVNNLLIPNTFSYYFLRHILLVHTS